MQASCHCGAVRIDINAELQSLTECTCSVCHRYGAQWAYCTRETAKVTSNSGTITAYTWGDKTLEFFHCNNCGCLTHYESIEKKDDSRIAVNARMMSPADVEGLKVRTFDGADTWKYLAD
jgi:hypothetical protein